MLSRLIRWQQKRAIGPLRSPGSCPCTRKNKTEETANKQTNRHKNQPQKKQHHQNKTTQTKPNTKVGQWCSKQLTQPLMCCKLRRPSGKQKPNNHKRWPRVGAEATTHVAKNQDPPSQDPGDHNVTGHDRAPDSEKAGAARSRLRPVLIITGRVFSWGHWITIPLSICVIVRPQYRKVISSIFLNFNFSCTNFIASWVCWPSHQSNSSTWQMQSYQVCSKHKQHVEERGENQLPKMVLCSDLQNPRGASFVG